MSEQTTGLTVLGKLISVLLIAGLIAVGVYVVEHSHNAGETNNPPGSAATASPSSPAGQLGATPPTAAADDHFDAKELVPTQTEIPRLAPPVPYQPKSADVIEVELSEYAGYSGLIAANGGMDPSENSVFFKKHGFKVKLSLSEEEAWDRLNTGKMAASATTADCLAVYGKQFNVTVPAQIGFSRGADGIVVRSEVKKINDLKGKTLAASQFTESDFFIRYLAQEAGLKVNMLPDLKAAPDADKVNLVYCSDGMAAGDLFLRDVTGGTNHLAGCVTWEPKTSEVVQNSSGRAYTIITNKNLLIIADVLIVNKGWAQQNPDKLNGLVDGLLEGNRMVRDHQEDVLPVIAKAFKWDATKARNELAKVHLSNLPENQAFFSGAIDAAGSFGGIYQSSVLAYGDLLKDPTDADWFHNDAALKAAQVSGDFKDQKIAIAPIKSTGSGPLENNPLLSKDIRFLFEPNSAVLDMTKPESTSNLEAIKKLLQVSPGSTVLLRGHVDNALVDKFRQQGGEPFVHQMALKAMELSKNRAAEIKRLLVEQHAVDGARVETVGRGWEEPVSSNSDENRRVEVQWFTVE